MALFYLSVPVNHDSETEWTIPGPKIKAATWNFPSPPNYISRFAIYLQPEFVVTFCKPHFKDQNIFSAIFLLTVRKGGLWNYE